MNKIGIFYGTDTGTTRLVAKRIFKALGAEAADAPKNVNRAGVEEFSSYDALILGTPSYGVGAIPGQAVGCVEPNWAEFLPQLEGLDFSGKRVALFGLGHQERYSERFASSLIHLYRFFQAHGAELIGTWSTEGYTFEASASIVDGRFVGLVVDQRSQPALTDPRIEAWLAEVGPLLRERHAEAA